MGILLTKDHDKKDNLSLIIKLPKSCYYPGELISGHIIIQVKNNNISSIFNFPIAYISVVQYQQYQLYFENILISKKDKKIILSENHQFKKYKNRSIIIPLSIPFSIKLPLDISPTFLNGDTNFIKHFLNIKFPQIKYKKSIGIIIQNRQRILNENYLFKTGIEKFNNINNSNIYLLFKTEKNSYSYNEIIPYEIIINYSESNLNIDYLRISLSRKIYFGACDKINSKIILFKNYKLPFEKEEKIFKISGHFLFPILSNYFSVNPMNIYNYFNKISLNDFNNNYNDIYLFPTCFSSLFVCCYFLNLEIIYDSFFAKNEIISIPIELYTPLKIDVNKNNNNKDN